MKYSTKFPHSLSPSQPDRPLYKYQQSLPKLPVPTLPETLAKYLRSVKPLLSEAEFKQTQEAVREFLTPNGVGELLQNRLIQRASSERTSWLYEWWNEYSYMGYRDPVVVYVSYFYVFNDDTRAAYMKPASRAASIITAALDFKKQVVEEYLQPESTKSGPLSMDQYMWLFNTCRIPVIPVDQTRTVDPKQNHDIVVVRKNKFYSFSPFNSDGKQLSTKEIEFQIQRIYEMAGNEKGAPVGLLTAENRDVWAKARDALIESPINVASLDVIEKSSMVVCLDDSSPVTREEASRACWHGDGQNRFFDKPLQFIIFENGKAGFCGEHSMMDATPTSRMCDWLCEALAKDQINHGTSANFNLPAPSHLPFEIFSNTESVMTEAKKNFENLIGDHDLYVQAYFGYGKNIIKKFRMSPDAYVQMAMQLAYYKMFGTSRATYESAQTRKFQFGRTETCRSVSLESVEWVKAMESSASPAEKAALGRKAIASHVAYMADCVEGKGCDRHLLGLKLLVDKNMEMPKLFKDKAFEISKHWNLSTSQITSEYYDGYGWGEVVPDGFGIAYMIKEKSIHFNVVGRKAMNAERMRDFLGKALDDMRAVFEAELENQPVPSKAKL
ncbi:Carnitine O-acetyltransferase mitochondrial [Nowakowskiella sp. JEL0407]|nr:Carnitine O-acetyltransferase mitochondrial [Nowakowskiella sp. JEL0407]